MKRQTQLIALLAYRNACRQGVGMVPILEDFVTYKIASAQINWPNALEAAKAGQSLADVMHAAGYFDIGVIDILRTQAADRDNDFDTLTAAIEYLTIMCRS